MSVDCLHFVLSLAGAPVAVCRGRCRSPVLLSARQKPNVFLTAVAARMALVAIHAVVHIPANFRVLEVICVVVPVARCALEHRVVV